MVGGCEGYVVAVGGQFSDLAVLCILHGTPENNFSVKAALSKTMAWAGSHGTDGSVWK